MLEVRGAQVSPLQCGAADTPLTATSFYTCRSAKRAARGENMRQTNRARRAPSR